MFIPMMCILCKSVYRMGLLACDHICLDPLVELRKGGGILENNIAYVHCHDAYILTLYRLGCLRQKNSMPPGKFFLSKTT